MSNLLKSLLLQPATAEPIHVQQIAEEIMKGNLTSSQIGAFLTALKLLNLETNPLYIKAVATAMRNASIPVSGGRVVDIVGTGTRYTNLGGDGHDTFNVSTAASIVVAGAGVKVAKHGNRASSSSCGSADILEALGCDLTKVDSKRAQQILKESNFCFLFAQMYHPAMKIVAGPRKELGIRTIFNILGPLTNPSNPTHMIVGVPFRELGLVMAQSLQLLGIERGWVVCGAIGLDEISPEGLTFVWDISDGTIKEFTITPADFGLPEHSILAMKGGNGAKNAEIMDQLLDNKLSGPILDFVLLNAAALLYVSGMGKSFIESVAIARESISSGKAREQFTYFLKASSA